MDIDIAIRDENWVSVTADLEGVIGAAINQIQDILDSPKLGELSIALVNDADIQVLNRDYRHKDRATNVLSFPQEGPLLGDIVLALETVQREAAEKSISLEHHITHLLIHGFLHLQGYDHETDETARKMEALEISALAALNIDNPYEIRD